METLNLLCPPPDQIIALHEPQLEDCAACSAPLFFLVPGFRPATRHLVQSLVGHVAILLTGFVSAMLCGPVPEKPSLNSTWRRQEISLITYEPRPHTRSNASLR
jgi:hypothetical protein